MSGQMKVDLSELEETVRKLKRVASAMESAKGHGRYRTELPKDALGLSMTFTEARELHHAHREMKEHIDEIIAYMNDVLDEFGTKTQKVHGRIQDAEYEAKIATSGGLK